MVGTHDTKPSHIQPRPQVEGKPAVLVPYYSAVEKECDQALRGLEHSGITVRRASFSAIDLLRSVMLSQALEAGFDRFLFIDSDVGFDPNDAIRLLCSARAGRGCTLHEEGWSRLLGHIHRRGQTSGVSGRLRRVCIPCSTRRPGFSAFMPRSCTR